jgi:hypothetical protein
MNQVEVNISPRFKMLRPIKNYIDRPVVNKYPRASLAIVPALHSIMSMIVANAFLFLSTGAVTKSLFALVSLVSGIYGLVRGAEKWNGIKTQNQIAQKFEELVHTQDTEIMPQVRFVPRNGESISFLKRKISFYNVRINLLITYIKDLNKVKRVAEDESRMKVKTDDDPFPNLSQDIIDRIDYLNKQCLKLEGKKEAAEEELAGLEGMERDKTTSFTDPAVVIERMSQSVPHLEAEIAILNAYVNDLGNWLSYFPALANAAQVKIDWLAQRKKVREEELYDINQVIDKIQTNRRLDPCGYEFVDILGVGGMGVVLKAYYPREDRFVAVKIFNLMADKDKARFKKEAQIAMALDHEGIAKGYDFNEDVGDNFIRKFLQEALDSEPMSLARERKAEIAKCLYQKKFYYYTTEYIRGYDLSTHLYMHGTLQRAEVLDIADQLADAIAYYSAKGLIHRDLKPENVLLRIDLPSHEPGYVKLIDFGIAKTSEGTKMTAAGVVVGTPGYMSLEQMLARKLDAKTDIYALGCIIFELKTGRTLFEGIQRPSDQELNNILQQNIHSPDLTDLLSHMLRRDVKQRATIEEVKAGIENCRAFVPTQWGAN